MIDPLLLTGLIVGPSVVAAFCVKRWAGLICEECQREQARRDRIKREPERVVPMTEPVTAEAVAHVLGLGQRMLTDLIAQEDDPEALAEHEMLVVREESLCYLLETHLLALAPVRSHAS